MKIMKVDTAYKIAIAAIFLAIIVSVSCKKNEKLTPQLTLTNLTDTIPEGGGTVSWAFTSNAAWNVETSGSGWLKLSQTSGNGGDATVDLTAEANKTGATRSVILVVNSANGQSRRITVMQDAIIYPSYNVSPKAPDATGMGSTAAQLAAKMTMGWNIYNTLDAPGWETGWGNPKVTQQLIDLVKSTGMNSIRIPCTWSNHIINNQTSEIDPLWLARVKEVVQYCINDNMYVILNTHHEGYIDCTLTGAKQDSVNAKHKAIWQQIATSMRDFDEHLILASTNEPNANDVPTTNTLMRYHRSFVDAVRSSGGKNTYRAIVIQSPSTSLDLLTSYLDPANVYKTSSLPTDPTPNKMMVEFHYYSPPQFCILGGYGSTTPMDASWGKELYFWGKDFHTKNPLFLDRNCVASTEEAYMDNAFKAVKTKFVDKGIPVVMGEFDIQYHAQRLTGHPADSILALKSGWHYYAYITKQAKAHGVQPFLWASGIFQRPNTGPAYIGDQNALDSLKKGAGF
ncbi:cellulase family glycosylhydrolase [Mucilaginibacter sp. ZT4R22]|uniref:Cellulase family glycosylhydrolase n=1 Tax=Mucilaginibacter pankratovii TaxID=2772110 RepID=A0ABR7WLB0_9SPHI|nr:cellulase family glycosylhydrolase [Mucilaginibacter pankratovii]MBD1363113.1 cellulase family glycosylhydrolase [Mucilaginibacter pankratovii]